MLKKIILGSLLVVAMNTYAAQECEIYKVKCWRDGTGATVWHSDNCTSSAVESAARGACGAAIISIHSNSYIDLTRREGSLSGNIFEAAAIQGSYYGEESRNEIECPIAFEFTSIGNGIPLRVEEIKEEEQVPTDFTGNGNGTPL